MTEREIHVTEMATALNILPLMPVGKRIYVTVRAFNRAGRYLNVVFSSPELKAKVSFSDRLLSVVCLSVCPSDVCLVDFYIFNFFRTSGPILTKVGTNHP
jgi:hypothetical protein